LKQDAAQKAVGHAPHSKAGACHGHRLPVGANGSRKERNQTYHPSAKLFFIQRLAPMIFRFFRSRDTISASHFPGSDYRRLDRRDKLPTIPLGSALVASRAIIATGERYASRTANGTNVANKQLNRK
jgi:hypothetical protein